MSDIFREVDEEVRRERLRQIWERYGTLIVLVTFIIVAGIGGWRAYQWWDARKAAEAGAVFESAMALSSENKHAEAAAAFGRIATEGNAGYRMLARLRQAAELAQTDKDAALTAYDAMAADTGVSGELRDLARVRAAMLLLDSASLADLQGRLEPVTADAHAFRHTARELLALAAWRAKDTAAVKRWADAIMADPQTPTGTRGRAEMLIALSAPGAKG